MAKDAAPGTLRPNHLQCGGGEMKSNPGFRRKTPSELRGEQLKRNDIVEVEDESSVPQPRFTSRGDSEGFKKPDIPTNLTANKGTKSTRVAKHDMIQGQHTIEKCSQNVFRSVTDLSSHARRLSDLDNLAMDKALKGLVTRDTSTLLGLRDDSPETCNPISLNPGNFRSECQISVPKTPLDLTLKTSTRIICSFSMKWFHRLLTCGAYYTTPQFSSQHGFSEGQNINYSLGSASPASSFNPKALHSWVYPQSPLPPSLISALTLSAKDGVEMDFLSKRQSAWKDAFRSLYYMLRKNVCHIFYVCTSHFVVMFTADDSPGKTRRLCNAYISQSSRPLRALLKKHDVCFSMPLCHSEVEQVTAEDLMELSEIEKHSLGQTRSLNSYCDIDNSPQSVLAFGGNYDVHGLYDFLLNYRSSLTFLAGVDVPVLYSPVPFQNAALSTPQVQYMETKTADQISATAKGSAPKEPGSLPVPSAGLCCSIELKDAYLPPWIISCVCATVCSEGNSFEASFTTEPTSAALNVALKSVCKKTEPQATGSNGLLESNNSFGIPEITVTPNLYSSTLKGLKYCNGSFTASILPV